MAKYREITESEANWIERNMRQLIKDMMEALDMEEEEVKQSINYYLNEFGYSYL